MKDYCIVDDNRVIFEADDIAEAMAFHEGKGRGVLLRVLLDRSNGFTLPPPGKPQKPTGKRKIRHTR